MLFRAKCLPGALGLILFLLASSMPSLASAQEIADQAPADPTQPALPSLPTSPQATPPETPVKTRVLFSQFADAPVSGDADETLRYGGKLDAYFDIRGGALGIDDSISIHIHPEFKYGESANGRVGLIPTNTLLFYPDDGEDRKSTRLNPSQ